jgi:hypothetical protein
VAYFLGYLAAAFLGNVLGGNIFEVGRRQIFQLVEAAELTFTVKSRLKSNFRSNLFKSNHDNIIDKKCIWPSPSMKDFSRITTFERKCYQSQERKKILSYYHNHHYK